VGGEAVADRIRTAVDGREQAFGRALVRAQDANPEGLGSALSTAAHLLRALEIAEQLGIRGSKGRIREVKAIERHLGNWNDLYLLEGRIIRFCSKKRLIRDHTRALRALYGLILDGRRSRTQHLNSFLETVQKHQGGAKGGG
jgi:hypothetical protein